MLRLFTIYIFFDPLDDKNPRDKDGLTPLHVAAAEGHSQTCEAIMKEVFDQSLPRKCRRIKWRAHRDKDIRDKEGWTPLHMAAKNGHIGILQDMMEYLKNKNSGANDGYTPLHLAVEDGRVDICKVIMHKVED